MPIPVDHEQVQRLLGEGAQLVEVLPQPEYEDEHLPGAINIPLKELDRERVKVSTARARSSFTATTPCET
jgi:rhodanese-related sulfurtransferase